MRRCSGKNDRTSRGSPASTAPAAIERHQDGDKTAFEADELRQTSFLRHLQIIGEAARALPAEVRTLSPELSWTKIIGMRNIVVLNVLIPERASCGGRYGNRMIPDRV